jgi:hypothetical protein
MVRQSCAGRWCDAIGAAKRGGWQGVGHRRGHGVRRGRGRWSGSGAHEWPSSPHRQALKHVINNTQKEVTRN